MGKKGSWFSAIKKVFTHSSKDKVADRTEKKSSKEKEKKGIGKLKHGDGHSFIPLFRKPSSIEKILGEAERNYAPPEQPKALPHVITPPPHPPKVPASPRTSTSSRIASPPRDAAQPNPPRTTPPPPLLRVASTSPPRAATRENGGTPASPRFVRRHGLEPTLKEQHIWATKIQAAYRGHMARRSCRAVRGMVRLQAVVKGQSVKRQTSNAMKCMQFLVRVQTQIQSRRIQMFEKQTLQRQALYNNDKDLDSIFSKLNLSENQDEWEDSMLTKEEVDARMRRKVDAIEKRERAMAYAYSHQLGKSTPRTAQSALMNNIRSCGFPYWWNWLEQPQVPPRTPTNPSQTPSMKSFSLTPAKPRMGSRGSSPLGQPSNSGQLRLGFDNLDTPSPRSTKSAIPSSRTKLARTPPGRLQKKFTTGSTANSPFNGEGFRDDDSLMSCPPFSGPRYMSPTASVKAKVRGGKEQFPDSPGSITSEYSNRRSSFPLDQDQFKWNKNKGPLFFNKETGSHKSLNSVGNMSVDSTVSMPATVGRKPFNRFV